MFPGSPAPLPPNVRLTTVVQFARAGSVLGVWGRECGRVKVWRLAGRRALVVGRDLGGLLRRCDRVVVRDGDRVVALATSLLIRWRVLEIVLGTPFLPPPAQLRALFPGLRSAPGSFAIPIGLGSAEEALAVCAWERIPIVSTRIAYLGTTG
jgi:hypothetical protein